MRALKVVLQVDAAKCNPKHQYFLRVGEKDRKAVQDVWGQYMMVQGRTSVLPIWSLPFRLGQKTKELFVERRLQIRDDRVLKVVEETGESIARHIWDAGLSASLVLASLDNERSNLASPELRKAIRACLNRDHVNILELGAGCGTFGITFATLFENCLVTLTDLGLAKEIADLNLKANSLGDRAKFVELDWTEPLPEHYKTSFGLVIMTDCTYNSAYFEPLVGVIDAVLNNNNRLLMAYKRRHEDEKEFFELMEAKGLEVTCRTKVAIEGDTETAQVIELLIYQRK
ncbi:S-adenosyl-L-methionine-dependent methyltransferase [Saitoella complicata NRRL Y-17804]|uniref:S-adenosyl-L-methionine-dependent methyltransferase n=1 Tax=Saitoella complicata (strain BCRC 22490 / CBS 7301 / JCM 7358 / NBRC 10748 / NRRL Y-17804) TaxID=698492 RepID=UPI000867B97E|nr:S-adenosyl-L-methionine-dependent methyltransferase [Saitoella complicata NRRL Y-17804]ODQ51694.1 S-adenosyl-L-methionine-dependent methyltransferase [Saitoella complicata NRRL Y-17804]